MFSPQALKDPHPAVVMFHGYDRLRWRLDNELLGFITLGFSVLAMDCRGQGGYSQDSGNVNGEDITNGHIIRGLDDTPDNLLFRHIFLDCAQLASIAMDLPEVDAEQVYATGWSQGGALTIACAALEPRVRKLAPVIRF